MVGLEIIGYIIGGVSTFLAIANFIYTWLKTRVKGPDFRINKIWGLTTNPTKMGNQMQCYITFFHQRWNYGDRAALFNYKIEVQTFANNKMYSNETSEEILLQPQIGDRKKVALNLPEGSVDWTEGTVKFQCDYFDHTGKPTNYNKTFQIQNPTKK